MTYHVGNLLSKFGCGNRAGLVARAYVLGYLDSEAWPPKLLEPQVIRRNPERRGVVEVPDS